MTFEDYAAERLPALLRYAAGPGIVAAPPAATASPAPVPPDPASWPAFHFAISPGQVAGFELQPMAVGPGYQTAEILSPGAEEPLATLLVYQPSAAREMDAGWDVAEKPARVEVNGAPGWLSRFGDVASLRWEYAPDAYAVVTSSGNEPVADDPCRRSPRACGSQRRTRCGCRTGWTSCPPT